MSNQHNNMNIPILLIFASVGLWEASIAANHQPDHVTLSGYEKEAYAFTVVKSILNICIGIIGICLFACQSDNKDNKKKSNMDQIYCINLGVTIWCIIMYSNIINNNLDFGPFKKVIIAEFIIFITSMCLLVFSCCAFIVFTCICEKDIPTDEAVANITKTTNKLRETINTSNQPIVTDSLQVIVTEIPISVTTTEQ
jgi:hypothetical protein